MPKARPSEDQILESLREMGAATVIELTMRLKRFHYSSISTVLLSLWRRGSVERRGKPSGKGNGYIYSLPRN